MPAAQVEKVLLGAPASRYQISFGTWLWCMDTYGWSTRNAPRKPSA